MLRWNCIRADRLNRLLFAQCALRVSEPAPALPGVRPWKAASGSRDPVYIERAQSARRQQRSGTIARVTF
jgi:hypothetical protein